jgi:hypothetical protein
MIASWPQHTFADSISLNVPALIRLRYIYGRRRYCTEVQRVLKEDGKFLMVSHGWKEKRIKWLTGHEHR